MDDLELEEQAERPSVEIHRNAWLLGGIGTAAALLAAAYLGRAAGPGGVLDWAVAAVMGGLAVAYLVAFVDARTPLLVADETGARVRIGRTWLGLPWHSVARLELTPQRRLVLDGRLVVVPTNAGHPGAPFSVPLGVATRVATTGGALEQALTDLAPGKLVLSLPEPPVSDVEAADAEWLDEAPHDDGPTDAVPAPAGEPTGPLDGLPLARTPMSADGPSAVTTRPVDGPPGPGRHLKDRRRSDIVLGSLALDAVHQQITVALPEIEHLRRPDFPELDFDPVADPEPIPDPVIGPQLATARRRLGITIADLAERTRVRVHVIEAIEVDDFGPCGGDFYARGHLRTLARVLRVDGGELVATYDELYARTPVTPREVFQAELATGSTSTLRSSRGGPNWSVLVAALMAIVLAWSIARLVIDGPVDAAVAPRLDGSGGVHRAATGSTEAVPVIVRAAGGGAHVVVRDGDGRVIFTGDLAYGASRSLQVAPPVRIESSDGSVEVVLDGEEEGALGEVGQPATRSFVP